MHKHVWKYQQQQQQISKNWILAAFTQCRSNIHNTYTKPMLNSETITRNRGKFGYVCFFVSFSVRLQTEDWVTQRKWYYGWVFSSSPPKCYEVKCSGYACISSCRFAYHIRFCVHVPNIDNVYTQSQIFIWLLVRLLCIFYLLRIDFNCADLFGVSNSFPTHLVFDLVFSSTEAVICPSE